MTNGKTYKVKRRRRREGKTNYRKRLALLKSGKKRLVVRIGNNTITAQIIKYKPEGDETLIDINSKELEEYSYTGHKSNTPAAYLTGLLTGKKATEEGIKEAVLDIGQYTPTKESKVFAVLKGALEAGLEIPHSPEVMPDDERTKGKHIEEHRNVELNVEEVAQKIKGSE